MRIYCSGPITNIPDLNRPAFDAAEKRLTAQGHFVINPHDLTPIFGTAEAIARSFDAMYHIELFGPDYKPSKVYAKEARLARSVMDADLAAVRSCDAIYLLRGWESSRGAKKELAEAIKCGLYISYEGDDFSRKEDQQ